MRHRRLAVAIFALAFAVLFSGCLPTHTIIVKFEDLKTDFLALENSLQEWAKFDWESMTITISGSHGAAPYALGNFETPGEASRVKPLQSAAERAAAEDELNLRTLDMSDTIVQLMRRRQKRFNEIMEIKRNGMVGETNQGLLGAPSGRDLSGASAETISMISDENKDRTILFHEVLRQKGLGADKIGNIAEKFAEVQRAMASKGVWIQHSDGKWAQVP